jgi:hypothetical protein
MCINLLLFFLIIVFFALFYKQILHNLNIEGYENYYLGNTNGIYPFSQTNVLVQDTYPITKHNGITDNGSNEIWWRYPIFKVGSYKQITNNIRYPNNPDTGRCMPASFCGALYNDKHTKTNYVSPLAPVQITNGTRVGYFNTNINMLPFRVDDANILY